MGNRTRADKEAKRCKKNGSTPGEVYLLPFYWLPSQDCQVDECPGCIVYLRHVVCNHACRFSHSDGEQTMFDSESVPS